MLICFDVTAMVCGGNASVGWSILGGGGGGDGEGMLVSLCGGGNLGGVWDEVELHDVGLGCVMFDGDVWFGWVLYSILLFPSGWCKNFG